MQQRLAYTLLIQISKSSSPLTPTVETFHATVQTADAPVTRYFHSRSQLKQWLEAVIPPHTSAPLVPISKAPLRKV